MNFRPEEYYQAGIERMQQAHRIYRDGTSYSVAMYCGGLAVECLLRAFRWSDESTFEGRHDLLELFKASRLLKIDDEYMRRKGATEDVIRASILRLRAAINETSVLWHNNLRFASEASLKAFLRRIGRVKGVRGDPRKKNAADLIGSAQFVINRGIVLWSSETRS